MVDDGHAVAAGRTRIFSRGARQRTRFTLPRQSIHTTTGWYGSELVPDLLTCRSQARIFCPQAALISMLVLGTRLDVGNTYVRRIHEEYGDGVVACYGTIRPCRR